MNYHELLVALTVLGVAVTVIVTALGLIASYLTTKTLAQTALKLAQNKRTEGVNNGTQHSEYQHH